MLRRLMGECVGVERTGTGLAHAASMIGKLRHKLEQDGLTSNMLTAAAMVAATALAREESRGGHYRLDFNNENPSLAHRSHVRLVAGEIELSPPDATSDPAQMPSMANHG